MRRRIGSVAGLLAAGCLLCGCGATIPGQAISWVGVPSSSPGSEAPIAVVTAVATPVAPGADAPSGGLWSSVWSSLNSNTAEVARGQYDILMQIQQAIADQINGLLQSVG